MKEGFVEQDMCTLMLCNCYSADACTDAVHQAGTVMIQDACLERFCQLLKVISLAPKRNVSLL
jgi:hypothetical protein